MKRFVIIALFIYSFLIQHAEGADKLAAIKTDGPELSGTKLLTLEGDIASNMVARADAFLLRKLEHSETSRSNLWKRDFRTEQNYARSIETNRARLAHILGVRDPRVSMPEMRFRQAMGQGSLISSNATYAIYEVEWPAFAEVLGRGLIAIPHKSNSVGRVIAIPDASQSPEQLFGLMEGIPNESQHARRFAEAGALVVVPTVVDRTFKKHGGANLSNREFLYRSAFVLGRHLIGYEIQKISAAVDWLEHQVNSGGPIITIGWGEGGALSIYAGALDTRIDAVGVSGYFENRNDLWQQPIDRNVFGLLEQFGDAELASLIAPRRLVIEYHRGPILRLPGEGGAPAELKGIEAEEAKAEFEKAEELVGRFNSLKWVMPSGTNFVTQEMIDQLLGKTSSGNAVSHERAQLLRSLVDNHRRMEEQIAEMDRHSQRLLAESPYVRAEFMKNLDFTSIQKYEESTKPYREFFHEEIIGRFDDQLLPFNAQSRLAYETDKWKGYEVVLDVFDGLFAYGVLLIPKNIKPEERRPVVVCQHGLEGRPQDIIAGDHYAYHDFAAKLAERGFITFSPQNLYIFTDRFRTLQRKANPLKKTLFSLITPQHQQIVNWLKTLPQADPERIGFYGLSYGGKTAMRVPALVRDYKFSICSADFNEWVWKNASTRSPYSYVRTGEYEIFEWDLGSTFNYAEMAALIAPRPFMVERGHFDGVAPDETVAYEYAKVRHLYSAKLKMGDRTEIEWFVGPHTINGQGTYRFIHKHFNWPEPTVAK